MGDLPLQTDADQTNILADTEESHQMALHGTSVLGVDVPRPHRCDMLSTPMHMPTPEHRAPPNFPPYLNLNGTL